MTMRGKNVISEWMVRARCVLDFWKHFLFVACFSERTASEILSIKPYFCHSVRKMVHLRKALSIVERKRNENNDSVQGGFHGKGKMYKNLKYTVSRINWNG